MSTKTLSMTEFQAKLVALIRKTETAKEWYPPSTTALAYWSKSNRLAVSSAMRSLEKRGLAGYFRSDDSQWAAQVWYLKGELAKPKVSA